MTDSRLTRFVALLGLLALWSAKSPAKEYVLTVGSEQLRFVPQGERGYVVKQAARPAGMTALAGTLFLEEGQVQPIGGLDRHGMWIVQNDGPASSNDAVMGELLQHGAAEYVAPLFSSNGETVAVIPEIVVRVKSDTSLEHIQQLCETAGCAIKKRMEFTTQEYLLEVLGPPPRLASGDAGAGPDAEAVFAAVEELGQAPEVEWACPNTASRLRLAGESPSAGDRFYAQDSGEGAAGGSATSGVFPNDEYFPMQWHLHNTGQSGGTPGADIHAPEAWEITAGDPNIIVAVLDTGVDSRHPDLVGNLVPGYDFYENDSQPDPLLDYRSNAHGTCCAGLIAAQGNNGIGVTGVTWNCKIMPIRVSEFPTQAWDPWNEITEADTATAFRWAAAHGADVFSNSWHYFYSPQPIMHSAIVDVTVPGGLGRDGKGCVFMLLAVTLSAPIQTYPQKYPEVVVVGSTNHNDVKLTNSAYGPELDVVAPSGGGFWTTDITSSGGLNNTNPVILDYTDKFGGTSGACPVAAGVAALILSLEPNLTSDEVRHFLERSAKDLGAPGRDDYYGWGRVDARAALEMVLRARGDFNFDRRVDLRDLCTLAEHWLQSEPSVDIAPRFAGDGVVDYRDFAVLAGRWLEENNR